ncbi:MAG: ATP synthase F1 subunit gamma [Bacteroidales bacterium]|nr:ATP synthase F1 subunit gamma [Bacteroidales bacterium]
MASLREIKDRIASVRSTLKITSAMKLVASAKLRKAQRAIEGMRPYERTLAEILAAVGPMQPDSSSETKPTEGSGDMPLCKAPTAVVAIASNSSLCGAFNANVIRKTLETLRACEGEVEVYPLGRRMAEALRRAGYTCPADYNDLIGHPSYDKSAALARSLAERYQAGEQSRVILVYNRFVSTTSQLPTVEPYLPFSADKLAELGADAAPEAQDYILEPDAQALVDQLLPQVMMLKFHAAILDSAAAEQAARTIAMQTASDNAEDLLGELTLEYNKGRQQKITAEILDLLGGAAN